MLLNFSLDKDIFKNDFLYKKPYLFKSAIDSSGISWTDVNELYSRGDISHRDFKLMNGYEVPKKEYVESYDNLGAIEYRCITSVLYEYLRNGATLVRNRIKNEPFVDQISKQIANFAEARTLVGGYAAFSSKSSYKSHWDTRDVYAVQLLGRKRWILRKPNFEFPLFMQQTKNFPDIKEPEEIYMDVILEAGDILYIPRGWWHDPLPLDEETFHLAVATFAPTGFEYMRWLQNIMPSILDCRKNFTNFENDVVMIDSLSHQVAEIIKDKNYYQSFMMHHLAEQSVPSMLSLDVLGNGKVSQLDSSQKLYLNANLLHRFDEDFVIINGNKINVDGISLSLIQYLFENPYSSVKDVLEQFNEHSQEKINKLLFQLSIENVIELVM
ncbi:JmjC domain-containing protein [Acinetobacter baumannii]|uniref:JmjC domain-containing protein n=2 Tax=Acinetobacter TaxID=469 RepID=UPI000277BF43|nr:cupin domain-containing protein [Acinetobacter baumannii]EHU1230674.1 cupin-like domain-containing protein [Acinetobacter baumannii]EHU1234655.1 cupin-like domain-containing protein [Acinetobacter baumannii]EHU1246948.1 cupin-like domain-containing protein [Acinetobacter baumannii]EHU1296308.1 cupin-like domain-containing protein [Acinetobacter baumannii]EHU1384937.1 cupin-like domain-containing protein [Acinetobacter baumannii]